MIREKLKTAYLGQYNQIVSFVDDIYIADYTEQTKTLPVKRSVEFFSPIPPTDINYFSIINTPKLSSDGIIFNNLSFIYGNGHSKSQCEAVFFPTSSGLNTWILFCELKYSSLPINNANNLKKAIRQLYRTHFYYIQENVIARTNNCYLIASLPLQSEPFTHFSISQAFLSKLKRNRNIILRLKNSIEIIDEELLAV